MENTNSSNHERSGLEEAGLKLDDQYRQWWAQRRLSMEPPSMSEILSNFGVRPELMELLLWEILADGAEYPKGPGHVGYLVRKLFFTETGQPEALPLEELQEPVEENDSEFDIGELEHIGPRAERVQEKINEVYKDMLQEALDKRETTNQISEQDVLSLVELFAIFEPRTQNRTQNGLILFDRPELWGDFVAICLRNKRLDSNFVYRIFERMPFLSGEYFPLCSDKLSRVRLPGYRSAFNSACLAGIKGLLPRIDKISLKGPVTERFFVECLELIRKSENITGIVIQPIHQFEEEEQEQDGLSNNISTLSTMTGDQNFERIEEFRLYFNPHSTTEEQEANYNSGSSIPALQLLPRMPNLRVLKLNTQRFPFDKVAPWVIQAMTIARSLEKISILLSTVAAVQSVLDILDSLPHVPSLSTFLYEEEGFSTNSQRREILESRVIEIMELNTKLIRVRLTEDVESLYFDTELGAKIEYYTMLNNRGRNLVRDSKTTIGDFVDLLASDTPQLSEDDSFNVAYGLLREAPSLWSRKTHDSNVITESRPNRKNTRKRKNCA